MLQMQTVSKMDGRSKVGWHAISSHRQSAFDVRPSAVRPSVRRTIYLRSALYRIGIAAQDRFPSFSRPASFAAFGPPVSPSVRVRP